MALVLFLTMLKSLAFDHKEIIIKSAYEEPGTGRLIIRFDEKSMMNNRHQLFYGTENELFQLVNMDTTKVQINGLIGFKQTFEDSRVNKGEGFFFEGLDPQDHKLEHITKNYTVVCSDQTKKTTYNILPQARIDRLQAKIRSGEVLLKPIPAVRQPLIIFKKKDGTIIYLDMYKYKPAHQSYRLFVGKPGAMSENRNINVHRRHGGIIVTSSGSMKTLLLVPGQRNSISPRWMGVNDIEPVDKAFDIASLKIEDTIYKTDLSTPCDKFFENQANMHDSITNPVEIRPNVVE